MTTLADLIDDATRKLTYQIKVNGVTLTSSSQATALNELTGVPGVIGFSWDEATAQIRVNRCPSWMRAGMPVTIDAGYNNLMMRVWTGSVVALPGEDPDYLRSKVIVKGATVQVGTPPDDVPVELTATATLVGADIQPPLPDGTHIEHEISVPLVTDSDRLSAIATRELSRYGVVPRRPSGEPNEQTILCGGELYKASRAYQLDDISLEGMTDADAINLICDLVGITKRTLVTPTDGWYTLDVGAKVSKGRPIDMLSELMQIGGLEAYHTEDGTVVFREVEFAPGPSHAWTYDVQVQANARIISATGELEVMFNPFIRKYSTGLLNIPFLNINSARVFVRSVRHSIGPEGDRTYIDAWGGSRLGGTLQIDPIAAFTFTVEREVIGTALQLVYTCDASSSFDPDGSIASYAWTCNRTTTPSSLSATQVMTFYVPATVTTPLTLTLTVTDNDGNTHATSVELPTDAGDFEMQIPAIYAALNNNASATPDGGSNWNDQSSSTCVSVDAKPADGVNSGIACFGYTDGSIKRTTDFCASALTTEKAADAADGTINEIWWDKNVTTRVWACTSTGRLYRSDNDGDTWVLHKDFGGTYPLHRIATPYPKGVWVFGGRGDVTSTLIQYEADVGTGVWNSVAVGGDLATALVGAGSALHVRSVASRMAGELIILLNGTVPAGSQDNIFYTANVFAAGGTGWTAATGLTAGLTDGREIVPDRVQGTFRALFADRSVWSTTNGVAFTETVNVLPAGFTPNRALWLGDYTGHSGTYLVAAQDAGATGGIYKSTDGLQTVAALRPATGFAAWPASALGKAIAIGAQAGTVAGSGSIAIVKDGAPAKLSYLQGSTWTEVSLPSQIDEARPRVYCPRSDLWFVCDTLGYPPETTGGVVSKATRSTDRGVTWQDAAIGDENTSADPLRGFSHIVADAGGRLWGVRLAGNDTTDPIRCHVYYSDTDGATWILSSTLTAASSRYYPVRLIAHPLNQNIIALITYNESTGAKLATHITANRGSSWTTNTVASTPTIGGDAIIGYHALMLPNGRIVFVTTEATYGTNDTFCYTSDDSGATYTLRQTIANDTHFCILAGASGSKIVLFQVDMTGLAPWDDSAVWISTNQGVTYTEADNTFPEPGTVGNNWSAKYDPITDTLYVVNGNDAAGALRVYSFSPVSADGIWTDISYNLAAGGSAWDALAVIP